MIPSQKNEAQGRLQDRTCQCRFNDYSNTSF